jgi:pyridoxine kinase
MKTVLSFHSQVAGARVGNSVAAFALERLGVQVLAMPTVLYGRRPDRGRPGGGPMPASLLGSMLEGLRDDGRLASVDAVFSGYVAIPEQIAIIVEAADKVRAVNREAVFVVDPIMGDTETGRYVAQDVVDGIVATLAPAADVIMPNAWEMALIAGVADTSQTAMRQACRKLGKPALVSSIDTPDGIGVLYGAPTGDWLVETARLPRAPKGTGDLLAALFLGRRLSGQAPAVALEAAVASVHDVIVRALASESDDLPLPAAQDLLVDPMTWVNARSLGVL